MYIQLRLPSNSTILEAISLRRPYNAFVSSRGVLMLYDSLEKWSLKKKHEQKGGSVVTNDVLTFSRRIKCTGNRFIVAVRKERATLDFHVERKKGVAHELSISNSSLLLAHRSSRNDSLWNINRDTVTLNDKSGTTFLPCHNSSKVDTFFDSFPSKF